MENTSNNQTTTTSVPLEPQQPVSQPAVPPVQPQVISQVLQQPITPETQTGTPQGGSPKSNKNKIIFGLLGLFVIVVLICVGIYFYMSTAPKKMVAEPTPVAQNVTAGPTREVVSEEKIVVVNSSSDLDGLLIELAQADESLEKELTAFDADSNF